ncbi:MAG: mandelate racemase/muconate lactonizing enzyme family protein [Chloroflexota bacterium]
MKITNIECLPTWGGRKNYLFVVVDTDEGIWGVGEGGISSRELAVQGAVEHLKEFLIGQDARRIEYLWQTMYRGGFFPAANATSAALAAIDIALWDIKGKALGVPVYELLGGLARERVVCYPHVVGASREELVENARAHVAQGWKFVRWGHRIPASGVFDSSFQARETVKDFEALRAALGDTVELCFDLHTRHDAPDAIWLCRQVEQYRPFFMEDPIRSESPESLRHVRRHVSTPLAIGEQYASKWEFRQVIEEELCDYARVDLGICGGITEAHKVAAAAEMHYIKLVTHNPLGPVSSAACLQLNLASPLVGVAEQPYMPGTLMPDVCPVQIEWKDGYLLPPTRPGLGIEFDREAARKSPFRMYEVPHLKGADGGLTNW